MMQPIQRVPFPGGDSPIPAATEVNGLDLCARAAADPP